MEVSKLCSSGIQELRWRSNRYDRMLSISVLTTTSKVPRWRLLWRKLMREKKKVFACTSRTTSGVHNVSYDPHTYAQNFDQGLIPADPDEFSRSFSARFAVPSRVFDKTGFIA
ncbi:hypothetical protein ERO13_A05G130300v2 [Gossypium hirsutum]|uniref:Uncharacterized protein n=2 Tax=Gossypium TaxID=3633 RepID=A0A2P5VXD4_GOSBA|nr:hypothetical protein ES319_A05G134000v1 [Gossypium barbadense]KAG4199117.1 hypothetical protein ERO13_A05G130300v2 [Gossypium hirsutum]PPR83501.1 hypothetical protein GOBAR_AA37208 [Gossypium barbadense]TYH16700.1 hypothetical protein ES288_A05G136100v1 [Gossypium darwinii]